MSVRSGESITVEFITSSFSTGAATNADSTPTGTLVVNGTDNAATVTVTNVDAGRYKAAVTLPTLAIGDIVELVVAATVSSVAGKGIVWRDTKDVLLDSSGDVTFNNAFIGSVTGSVGSVSGNVGGNVTGSVGSIAGISFPTHFSVLAIDAGGSVTFNNTTIATATSLTNLPAIPSSWLTAAGIAAGALDGKGDWLLASSYTAPPTTTAIATAIFQDLTISSDFTTAGSIGKLFATNLDTNVGSRGTSTLTQAQVTGGAYALNTDGSGNVKVSNGTGANQISLSSGAVTVGTNNDKTGYALSSAGLDSIVIESGMNARQALAVIASASAGVLDGAATTTVTIAAAGVPATNRISATVDSNGNRSAVTLALP